MAQGEVINYEALMGYNKSGDRLDADNFYPYIGDDDDEYYGFNGLDADNEAQDIEFSNGEGGGMKKLFQKGGVKSAIAARQEGTGARLSERERKLGGRIGRTEMRKTSRETRRNMRQMASWKQLSDQEKKQAQDIADKTDKANGNDEAGKSLKNVESGVATPPQEQLANSIMSAAAQDVAAGRVGFDAASQLDENGKVADTWWKKQTTAAKAGIIGGGVVALGLGIWAIIKLRKK